MLTPGPVTEYVQCYLQRTKHAMHTEYELYLKEGDTLLATATSAAKDSSVRIFAPPAGGAGATDPSPTRLGKLQRSGALGTEFCLVDAGFNTKKKSVWDDERDKVDVGEMQGRTTLCTASYSVSFTGERKLAVKTDNVKFVSKQPTWDAERKKKVLDFRGRVTMASRKNFQLVTLCDTADETHSGPVIMQFGKVGKDGFNLDFCGPFSGLQAFGVALSVFGAHK